MTPAVDHFLERSAPRSVSSWLFVSATVSMSEGLRSKAFTLDSGKREATNFYVWDSEAAAKAFFNDELLERLTGLYGVRPSIEFVQIAALVENVRA